MRSILWTHRARADLAAIRAFISRDSAHYADVMVGRIIGATERLSEFPESGRRVPEFERSDLREVILRPYRIVYRLAGREQVHIIAVHHGSRLLPPAL